jgi:hypothetical protein
MTKYKKILIGVSGILLFAVGCYTSFLYGFRQGIRAGGVTSSMAEVWLFHEHMADQMANANCEGAKKALLDHLALIEKYKGVEGGLISSTVYYGDKMLDHTRLSRIEKQLGNETAAKNHMTIAIEACTQRGWKDCSEEKLIHFSKRLEEKNPIACLSSAK